MNPARTRLETAHGRVTLEYHVTESRIDRSLMVVFLEYRGMPEALIAVGAATPEMLAPSRSNRRRFDADGDYFFRQPVGKQMEICREKPIDRAMGLPGFDPADLVEMIPSAQERRREKHENLKRGIAALRDMIERLEADLARMDQAEPQLLRGGLRLVVDNTRPRPL